MVKFEMEYFQNNYRIKRNEGSYLKTSEFLKWFKKQPAKEKILVPGNEDFFFENNISKDVSGIHVLVNRGKKINGINFYGLPALFHGWKFPYIKVKYKI